MSQEAEKKAKVPVLTGGNYWAFAFLVAIALVWWPFAEHIAKVGLDETIIMGAVLGMFIFAFHCGVGESITKRFLEHARDAMISQAQAKVELLLSTILRRDSLTKYGVYEIDATSFLKDITKADAVPTTTRDYLEKILKATDKAALNSFHLQRLLKIVTKDSDYPEEFPEGQRVQITDNAVLLVVDPEEFERIKSTDVTIVLKFPGTNLRVAYPIVIA